jgi:malate dehydrogenase (oxaloacetate-decarboxylating)(NADP+)
MFDKDGVLKDRTDLSLLQQRYATDKRIYINRAIKGADVFLGLSAGNVLSAEMLLTIDNPVVLQWQIQFLKSIIIAIATRTDIIMATEDQIIKPSK